MPAAARPHRRMSLALREDENGKPDLSDAVELATASAVLHHRDLGAWLEAIPIAAYENQPGDVLYDVMRTAVRTTGPEVIDGVVAATTPPPGAERLAMLDRAAQDLDDERRREGLTMRVAAAEGRVTERAFAAGPAPDASSREVHAVGGEAMAKLPHSVAIIQADAEVHPRRGSDLVIGRSQCECEPLRVVEHQDPVPVASRWARPEAEIRLAEVAESLLVTDGNSEMIHRPRR
jgi:hypothetical protein